MKKELTIREKFKLKTHWTKVLKCICKHCEGYESMGKGHLYHCALLPNDDGYGGTTYLIVSASPCTYQDWDTCPLVVHGLSKEQPLSQ